MTDINALPALEFGAELRRQRVRAGMTQERLAAALHYTDALVGFVETGKRLPTPTFADACDALFLTGGHLARMCALARRFGRPAASLTDLLAAAVTLRLSDPLFVPDLAQTTDYARALLHATYPAADLVDAALDARPRLSELLDASPELTAWLVIDEAALYRPVGGVETLRLQLKELAALVESGRVIAQVLPTSSAAPALLRTPLVLMSFREGADIAHLPDTGMAQLAERYGDATRHNRHHDVLRALAWPPDRSLAMIRGASR
jgi:transcriptional regulator with XRE-family HTH domain